jgi:hypothetical protein
MKKNKLKIIIIFIILIIVLLPISITFSKFVIKTVGDYILEANNFYFSSDKLTVNNASYNINNWSGVGDFTIQFELNDKKNNILSSTSDITYNLTTTCDSDITCTLNKTEGILYASAKTESFTLTVSPLRAFNDNESIHVQVIANATSPYKKTLSANYTITVGKRGISYAIDDAANQPTLTFTITNALTYYTVDTAFGTYSVGDKIDINDYLKLSAANKANCTSYKIQLTFDPNVVILDTTSTYAENSTKEYTTVNNISYISKITFKVDATSSTEIRFYKIDPTQNYTYPVVNTTSIIDFATV